MRPAGMVWRRWPAALVGLALLVVLLAWLRDPAWIGDVSTGLRPRAADEEGRVFRWSSGRASFYVPSAVGVIDLPLRAERFTPDHLPLVVMFAVDGRPVDGVRLEDEDWRTVRLRIDGRSTSRRYRRLDLRVDRTWSEGHYGVQVGEWTAVR